MARVQPRTKAVQAASGGPELGEYLVGIWISTGAAIGLIFGILLDNLPLGIALGAGLGVVIGAAASAGRRSR